MTLFHKISLNLMKIPVYAIFRVLTIRFPNGFSSGVNYPSKTHVLVKTVIIRPDCDYVLVKTDKTVVY